MQSLLRQERRPLTPENVGYYMDVLSANLQQQLAGDSVNATRHVNDISITFPGALTFPSNSASIHESAKRSLALVATTLREFQKTLVMVEGHTDNRGDAEYNQQLSEKRALAIGKYFVELGVAANRLLIIGVGADRPVGDNQTPAGRSQNRRVEIILQPVTTQ